VTQTPLFQDQRVKGQGHQAALLSAALTRKAAAAVSIGNVFGVGKYCYVASARRRARRLGAHGTGEGRGHIVSPRAQLVVIVRTVAMRSLTTMIKHKIKWQKNNIMIVGIWYTKLHCRYYGALFVYTLYGLESSCHSGQQFLNQSVVNSETVNEAEALLVVQFQLDISGYFIEQYLR